MESISFDRAADFYDATRSNPPGIIEQAAAVLAGRLPRGARLLEIGVGTGRIALPLMANNLQVTGIDISRKMMERLRLKLDGPGGPDLVEGSALALPLAAGRFEAVVGVHVLHLIPGWRTVIEELRRVLRPGGRIVMGYDWRPDDCPSSRLRQEWDALVQSYGVESHPVMTNFEEVLETLQQSGAHYEEQTGSSWTTTFTLQDQIEKLESRTWSGTWHVPEEALRPGLVRLRAWAEQTYGPLDKIHEAPRRFVWQHFTWN